MVLRGVRETEPASADHGDRNMAEEKTSRSRRPHREPLPDEWAKALLQSPCPSDQAGPLRYPAETVYDMLRAAKDRLAEAVKIARWGLEVVPYADVVAREAAKNAGKRGDPIIVIDDDGSVMLEVRYTGSAPEVEVEAEDKPASSKKWASVLPSLEALREEAETRGIDISDLGRSKRKILERIRAGRPAPPAKPKAPEPPEPPRPKMVKTAPALAVKSISLSEAMAAPKPTETPKSTKPSLAALAAEGAEDEDLLALLGTEKQDDQNELGDLLDGID